MEKVLCDHKFLCIAKTGLTEGPTYGGTFYLCPKQDSCGFIKQGSLPWMECPEHQAPVGYRKWISTQPNTFKYCCSKKENRQFCGTQVIEKENVSPNEGTQDSLPLKSSLPDPKKSMTPLMEMKTPFMPGGSEAGAVGVVSKTQEDKTSSVSAHRSFDLQLSMEDSDTSTTSEEDIINDSEYFTVQEEENVDSYYEEFVEDSGADCTPSGANRSLTTRVESDGEALSENDSPNWGVGRPTSVHVDSHEADESVCSETQVTNVNQSVKSKMKVCLDESDYDVDCHEQQAYLGKQHDNITSASTPSGANRSLTTRVESDGEAPSENDSPNWGVGRPTSVHVDSHEADESVCSETQVTNVNQSVKSKMIVCLDESDYDVDCHEQQAYLGKQHDNITCASTPSGANRSLTTRVESDGEVPSENNSPNWGVGRPTSVHVDSHEADESVCSETQVTNVNQSVKSKMIVCLDESDYEDPPTNDSTVSAIAISDSESVTRECPLDVIAYLDSELSSSHDGSDVIVVQSPENSGNDEPTNPASPVQVVLSPIERNKVNRVPEEETAVLSEEVVCQDPTYSPVSIPDESISTEASDKPLESSTLSQNEEPDDYSGATEPSPSGDSSKDLSVDSSCHESIHSSPGTATSGTGESDVEKTSRDLESGVDEPDYCIVIESSPTGTVPVEKEKIPKEPEFKVGHQYRKLVKQFQDNEKLIATLSDKLPDGGAQLQAHKKAILERMARLNKPVPQTGLSSAVGGAIAAPVYHSKGNLTYQAKMLSSGAVEHLHSSLANCPTEETLSEDPPGLMVTLMAHQKMALAWLEWRETQKPSGGILADDMGLGKTLSMLSLVLKKKRNPGKREWVSSSATSASGLMQSHGTLVVCPASLMSQWEQEVKSKIQPGLFRVKIYHGSNRTKSATELASYDLVITTYNIVNVEGGCIESDEASSDAFRPQRKRRAAAASTLFQVYWDRVILDEAHIIRNPKSGTSIGACNLKSDHHWAVTGTPIQNKLKDFYSLIKFIRLAPFDDFRVWKDTVERKGTVGMQRLNTMVSSLVLRRTKEDTSISKMLQLTKREEETHLIELSPEEQEVYKVLFTEARKIFCVFLREQSQSHDDPDGGPELPKVDSLLDSLPPDVMKIVRRILCSYSSRATLGRTVLTMLLRLRQCCNHLYLLTSALAKTESDQGELDLELAMGTLSLEEDSPDSDFTPFDAKLPDRFLEESASTKIREVLKMLHEIQQTKDDPPQKSLIISQWTSMLNIMQYHLGCAGISYTRIDGKVPPKSRSSVVCQFNAPRPCPAVMLLSLQAGGVGLNLTGANHVFVLDMHWNPAVEEQAADRCHRFGQTRDVFIHRFICQGTVEQRILNIQEKKRKLSKDVLSGASQKARRDNKLSLNDLKHLFEI